MEAQRPSMTTAVMIKQSKAGGTTVSDCQTYSTSLCYQINMVLVEKQTNSQWNRTENPKTTFASQYIFSKDLTKDIQNGERAIIFSKCLWENWVYKLKRNQTLIPHIQNSTQKETETLRILKKHRGKHFRILVWAKMFSL